MAKRGNPKGTGGPGWHKGMVSPNPGGRPKDPLKTAELARQHGPEVVEKLLAIVRATPVNDPSGPQMAAFNMLLERGFGRAPQAVAIGGEINVHAEGAGVTALLEAARRESVRRENAKLEAGAAVKLPTPGRESAPTAPEPIATAPYPEPAPVAMPEAPPPKATPEPPAVAPAAPVPSKEPSQFDKLVARHAAERAERDAAKAASGPARPGNQIPANEYFRADNPAESMQGGAPEIVTLTRGPLGSIRKI